MSRRGLRNAAHVRGRWCLLSMVAVVALLAGCGSGFEDMPAEAAVSSVTVMGDGTEVAFSIGLCERPLLEFAVEETPDQVRVRAVSERGPDPDDCALQREVTLDEPLGDRAVIDMSTGERVTQIHDITE